MPDNDKILLSSLSDRFLSSMDYIQITGYKLKQNGIINNEATLTKIKKGIQQPSRKMLDKYLEYYNEINPVWLLTGEGEMLIEGGSRKTEILSSPELIHSESNYKLVPIVHIDSVGGMRSNNEIQSSEPQYIEGYVPFVNARDDDRAILQTGNSMIPTCPPGSLLQIREVPDWREYFGFGNIFVIELKDGRRITKEVNRYDENPKDYVWCKSHNPEVADEELPKSMIASVWKVIKVLTDKGW